MTLTTPPELCTALTNGVTLLLAAAFLVRFRADKGRRALLWRLLIGLLALTSALGLLAHLFVWPPAGRKLMWSMLAPMLCMTAAFFLLAVGAQTGASAPRTPLWKLLPALLGAAVVTAVLAHAGREYLFVPIVYGCGCIVASLLLLAIGEETDAPFPARVVLLAALGAAAVAVALVLAGRHFLFVPIAYGGVCLAAAGLRLLRAARESAASRWMLGGLAVLLAGGVVMAARSLHFTLIWAFDFNSVFHLATAAAVGFFWRAYRLCGR